VFDEQFSKKTAIRERSEVKLGESQPEPYYRELK
jgi:hypothetical protein